MKQCLFAFLAYFFCLLVLNHEWMLVETQEVVTNSTASSSTVRTTTQRPRRIWNTTASTTFSRRTTTTTPRPANRTVPTSTLSTTKKTTTATVYSTTTESNEKAYVLIKQPADVLSSAGSRDSENAIGNRTKDQAGDDDTTTVMTPIVPPASNTWFFDKFLVKFNRYTLIMVTAFVIGLFLIALLVAVVLCICKGFSGKPSGDDVIFNPMYADNKDNKKNGVALSPPQLKTSGRVDFLTADEIANLLGPGSGPAEAIEMKPISPDSPDSPGSSSLDSKAIKSPSTPERMGTNQSSPTMTKSASADTAKQPEGNEPSSSAQKYVPSYVQKHKTASQMNKEGQNSASRRSLNRKSECFDETNQSTTRLNKRQSTASSTTSIPGQTKIDFNQAKEGVDELFSHMDDEFTKRGRRPDTMLTDSRPSLAEPNSTHISTTDIFIKAIAERIEGAAKAKLPRQISNLSSDTTASSSGLNTPEKKKPTAGSTAAISSGRSMGALNSTTTPGVSTDPSGGVSGAGGMITSVSRRSLAQSRTDSVNTIESEKSCY